MMKLTTNLKKLTKSQLVLFLKEQEDKIKDESLLNEVVDALINSRKLKKENIYNLADKVQTFLLAQNIVENSKKSSKEEQESKKEEQKTKKKLTKKEPQKEAKEEPQKEAKEEQKQKEAKKKKLTKKEPKKFQFPKEIKLDDTTYKINNRIKSIEGIQKLISQGKKIIFANVWTAEHLNNYVYDIYGILDEEIKEFPNDLDLAVPVLISRNNKIIYTVSVYTDIMSVVLADQLASRNAFGVDFRIYVAD